MLLAGEGLALYILTLVELMVDPFKLEQFV